MRQEVSARKLHDETPTGTYNTKISAPLDWNEGLLMRGTIVTSGSVLTPIASTDRRFSEYNAIKLDVVILLRVMACQPLCDGYFTDTFAFAEI